MYFLHGLHEGFLVEGIPHRLVDLGGSEGGGVEVREIFTGADAGGTTLCE